MCPSSRVNLVEGHAFLKIDQDNRIRLTKTDPSYPAYVRNAPSKMFAKQGRVQATLRVLDSANTNLLLNAYQLCRRYGNITH